MEDLERDVVRLQERVARLESLRQRFYDILPAAVNIAVILFVIVQLMGFDDRLDGVEQRWTVSSSASTVSNSGWTRSNSG